MEYAKSIRISDPVSYTGSKILFVGEVIDFNERDNRLQVILQEPPFPQLEVLLSADGQVFERGDIVEIIGVIEGAYLVSARDIFLKQPLESVVAIVRSVPAIPILTYVFYKTWKFDRKDFLFLRRDSDA